MPRQKPQLIPTSWASVPHDRLSLFRLPPKLDLTPAAIPTEHGETADAEKTAGTPPSILLEQPRPPTASIAALPPEIVLEIASYLHPVDRICLALTCKSLLSSTLQTLRCTPTDWVFFHDLGYSCHMPMLYERLAHGWIPQDRFRYCPQCYKILPRCPEYFKQRLRRTKKPKYDGRVACTGVTEKRWNSMSKKKRYAHLLHYWCHSEGQKDNTIDSFCLYCREKMVREGRRDCEFELDSERGTCSAAAEAVVPQDSRYLLSALLAAAGVAGLLDAVLLRVGRQVCV
ncbi:hypothetical protein A1O7_01400 [Cladophialophora yegresii CBS 114405]|uniref:F-box domain-containing protein n=1 Tax=Cladophialophora yegresii CBS 114405 TaxID=1182544 RepID=W9WJB3_9EURO|nr:uncharacterized protein A1O7_01400 [Cladophialophora yegresii CBS 114405]EXJ65060.1 hypothetical protein A1O7_01400 [Cladophialophora yegresii CBS 114405]